MRYGADLTIIAEEAHAQGAAAAAAHLGEDDDLVDAVGARLGHKVREAVGVGEALNARHGGDALVLVALVHKERQDEVAGAEGVLLYGGAHGGGAPVAARPVW